MSDMVDAQAEMVYWLENVEFEASHQRSGELAPDIKGLACVLLDFPGEARVLVECHNIGKLYFGLTEVVTAHALSEVQVREKLVVFDRLVDLAWKELDKAHPQPA